MPFLSSFILSRNFGFNTISPHPLSIFDYFNLCASWQDVGSNRFAIYFQQLTHNYFTLSLRKQTLTQTGG
jgi:hypothetical protein